MIHNILYNRLWWPENGIGYAIGSSWAGATAILSGVIVFWHKHNCHEHRCLRISWKEDKDGFMKCKVHHPDHPAKSWFRSDRSHSRHAVNRKTSRL